MLFQLPSKPNSNKHYLIFDFDETIGTLLIDWKTWHRKVVEILQKYEPSASIPAEEWSFELENRFIKKFGSAVNRDLIQFKRQYEGGLYKGCEPNSALVEFIKKAKGFEIFIWSNNHSVVVNRALAELGLVGSIDRLLTRDMVSFAKPHPDGFSQLYVPNTVLGDYLFIGDSGNDEKVAAKIGIDYLDVNDFERLIKE